MSKIQCVLCFKICVSEGRDREMGGNANFKTHHPCTTHFLVASSQGEQEEGWHWHSISHRLWQREKLLWSQCTESKQLRSRMPPSKILGRTPAPRDNVSFDGHQKDSPKWRPQSPSKPPTGELQRPQRRGSSSDRSSSSSKVPHLCCQRRSYKTWGRRRCKRRVYRNTKEELVCSWLKSE